MLQRVGRSTYIKPLVLAVAQPSVLEPSTGKADMITLKDCQELKCVLNLLIIELLVFSLHL